MGPMTAPRISTGLAEGTTELTNSFECRQVVVKGLISVAKHASEVRFSFHLTSPRFPFSSSLPLSCSTELIFCSRCCCVVFEGSTRDNQSYGVALDNGKHWGIFGSVNEGKILVLSCPP